MALLDLRNRKLKRSARGWIESNDRHVGGFLFVCETLSLSPTARRRATMSKRLEDHSDDFTDFVEAILQQISL